MWGLAAFLEIALLLWLLQVLSICTGSASIHQFELKQYEYFLNHVINASIPMGSKIEQELFLNWSNHDLNAERLLDASYLVNNYVRHRFPQPWKRTMKVEAGSKSALLQVDCNYFVQLENVEVSTAFRIENSRNDSVAALQVIFRVEQFNCTSGTDIPGGAAIDALSVVGLYGRVKHQKDVKLGASGLFQLERLLSIRCSTEDLFSNQYLVHCWVPYEDQYVETSSARTIPDLAPNGDSSDAAASPAVVCLNISLTLQYEHYDAYSELKLAKDVLNYSIPFKDDVADEVVGKQLRSQGYEVVSWPQDSQNNQVFCLVHASAEEIVDSKPLIHSHGGEFLLSARGYWTTNLPIVQESSVLNQTFGPPGIRLGRIPVAASAQPIFQHVNTQLSPHQIHFCLKYIQSAVFIGESHARFAWDFIIKGYFNKETESLASQQLPEPSLYGELQVNPFIRTHINISRFWHLQDAHHGSLDLIRDFTFEWAPFVDNLAKSFLVAYTNLTSPSSTSRHKMANTIIVQTGFWDLHYYPIRNYLENSQAGIGRLIEAIKTVISKQRTKVKITHSRGEDTVKMLNVIVIDTMVNLDVSKSRYWQNNFAVAASNQRLFNELKKLIHENGGRPVRVEPDKSPSDEPTGTYDNDCLYESYFLPEAAVTISLVNFMELYFGKHWGLGAVCGLHASCRYADAFFATPQGTAARNILLHIICGVSHMENLLLQAVKLDAQSLELAANATSLTKYLRGQKSRWREWEVNEYDIVQRSLPSQTDRPSNRNLFLISKGMKRHIPNDETFHFLVAGMKRNRIEFGSGNSDDVSRLILLNGSSFSSNGIDNIYDVVPRVRELPSELLDVISSDEALPRLQTGLLYYCIARNIFFVIDDGYQWLSCSACVKTNHVETLKKRALKLCPVEELLHLVLREGDPVTSCSPYTSLLEP
jgi:hypothetical protein